MGSLGDEFVAWSESILGIELWPWQREVADRALEVRADGSLRWNTVIVSVPRQCGKSHLSRALLGWRLVCGETLFGEPQVILSMAQVRQTAREVWKLSARQLQGLAGDQVMVRYGNGQEAIEWGKLGSQWLVTSATPNSTQGLSVSCALLDEAWDIAETVYHDAVSPTMLQRTDPQAWLVSTAGDSSSDLLRDLRGQAIAQMGSDPDQATILLMEWSAAPDRDIEDREGWREASPIWNERRERQVANAFAQARSPQSFQQQYLNQWQTSVRGWLPSAAWDRCQDDRPMPPREVSPGTCAVEVSVDHRSVAAVLVATDADGRLVVRSKLTSSLPAMRAYLEQLAQERRGMTILHHETVKLGEVPKALMVKAGRKESIAGFSPTQEAIEEGLLAHDGDQALREQVLTASTWRTGTEGYLMLSQNASNGPIHAARALVWAVGHQLQPSNARRPLIAAA